MTATMAPTSFRNWIAQKLASAYVAGPDLDDAMEVCRAAARRGWTATLCRWDGPQDTPASVAASYRLALWSILLEKLPCYLSIKAPALAYDPEVVCYPPGAAAAG